MTATRTIFFGAALGLAAGAAALAQDADAPATTPLGADSGTQMEIGQNPELPLDGMMGEQMELTADTKVETALPEGDALVAAADELIGARVYDANEEWVGEVSELLPATGTEDQRVVIDIGGFLGFGETPVEIDADDITVAWTDAGEIDHARVALTEEELERMANSES